MSLWNLMILMGAAAAALVPLGGSAKWAMRYLAWLAAIVTAYMSSVVYWKLGLPYPEAFGFFCDGMLVLAFIVAGRFIWESRVAFLFLLSTFINMAYLAHNLTGAGIVPHDVHGALLELVNFLAIGTIGITAAFDQAGHRNGHSFDPWLRVFGVVRRVPGSGNKGP